MFWIITIAWFILGTAAFWIMLSIKWARIDPLFRRMFETFRVFHPIPGFPNYLDLKFSVLRHAIVFLASSALIFWVNTKWFISVLLFLNVLYAWLTISRYTHRKRDVAETAMRPTGKDTAAIIAIPVRDSFCVVVFSVICSATLYILFAIKT